ncbi:4-hydroxybenzoate polyprenyltransferase, mitochondrial [Cyphellophora attinorum]|uniref:4-hydroxybenzoate polyprenyltransferase, mitochondrial n=1 Tax=Cyphellophora attinorum TaxID=1664694 RepID=A0A0N1H1E9_9EURO|nr:4-hydroxybenzoate polyprenyltransferase, mitochondrial [Phialophora attinorum]KPI37913.1 4-hydroxybenzoate polyprenyltransferase, mitochondrial [Phialophora attinorum]
MNSGSKRMSLVIPSLQWAGLAVTRYRLVGCIRSRDSITARWTTLGLQHERHRSKGITSQPEYLERRHASTSASIDTSQPAIYKPPSQGLISKLPPSWIPYAELARLDKPAGTYYLYFPCLFATLLAAPLAVPVATPLEVMSTSALFFAGALIMRGAGCTINDLWDRNLDPKVERTRLRPIARRAVTPQNAVIFLGFQLLTGLGILLQFPIGCFFYATPSLFFVTVYPLAKRVTNYPQFVLGLTFSWGAIVGFPAMGVDLLSHPTALGAAAALYASCVTWTLNYDMIYAFQDIKDDVNAGIKSIALAHDHNAKAVLLGLSAVQVGLLGLAGYLVGAGPVFFAGSCAYRTAQSGSDKVHG